MCFCVSLVLLIKCGVALFAVILKRYWIAFQGWQRRECGEARARFSYNCGCSTRVRLTDDMRVAYGIDNKKAFVFAETREFGERQRLGK